MPSASPLGGQGSGTSSPTSSAATCSTSWNTLIPTVTLARGSSSSGARATCTWCRFRLRPPARAAGYGEVTPKPFARRRTSKTSKRCF